MNADDSATLQRILQCLERLVYELASGRRMEYAAYLREIVYGGQTVQDAPDEQGAAHE